MKTMFTTLIASAVGLSLSVQSAQAISPAFDLLDHTSQLNYYHPAKTDIPAADVALPSECKVDQVHAVARHTTRYPSKGSYNGLARIDAKVKAAVAAGNTTDLAAELAFLKTFDLNKVVTNPATQVENITALGIEEGKEFGKTMHDKYEDLFHENATVWSGSVERVQLTAKAFMDGYFGTSGQYANLVTSNSSDTTLGASTLTPIDTCPNFIKDKLAEAPQAEFRGTWVPQLLARFQALWPSFGFIADDVLGMMDMCMYDMNLLGKSERRFCNLFTDSEWEAYAYNRDLGYYYGSGHGNPLAKTAGFPYIEAVAKLLAEPKTPYCQKVFVAFSHDTQLMVFATAYGLRYDATLPGGKIDPARNFRSSRQVAMGSRLVTERIKCGKQRYVRVSINDAVVPFEDCKSGPGLSCPMDDFQTKITTLKQNAGDFITTCGVKPASASVTSTNELFEKPLRNLCPKSHCE